MKNLNVVGHDIIRPDALDKALGRAKFVDYLVFPGMLFASIVPAPCAHARLISFDSRHALEIDGVLDVVTSRDIPGKNFIPMIKEDWYFLPSDTFVFCGQPVAVVIADSRQNASFAADAVKLEYEELEPIFDPEDSLKLHAPQINSLGNLLARHCVKNGDINIGFEQSDVIIEGVYETGYQEHAYLETQGVIARPSGNGVMEIYASMQCPFYVQNAVSSILGIPHSKVRVVQTPTGGAFGGKEDIPSLFCGLAALGAWKTGRPVKMVLDRGEDIIMSSKRHPAKCYYRTGAASDGTLTACEATIYLDAGAFATLTPSVLWRCNVHACGPYRIPHVSVNSYAGATNKVPCGAFRGFGTPKIIFAMERQMDRLAKKLGMDPVEFRKHNILKQNDETVTGQRLPWSVGLEQTLEKAVEDSAWKEKWASFPSAENNKLRGIGCATFSYGVGLGAAGKKIDRAEAYVQVKADGSVIFAVGTVDMGQGMETVLTQIVSESLGGIPPDNIQMLPVDTTRIEDSGPTVASRATYTSGNALVESCDKILKNMYETASKALDCSPSEILLQNGKFTRSNSSESLDFAEVASRSYFEHLPLSAYGYFKTPDTTWDADEGRGKAYVTYSYATQIAEVEVDMETGEIEVLDIWAAHDVGKAINPKQVEAQIEGGSIQGLGYALLEDLKISQKGFIENPSFSTYIIPSIMDVPEIHPIIVEDAYPEGPYGAKGFGETPLMGMAACISNAVSMATGFNITRIPILPEHIIGLLKEDNKSP